MEHLLKVRIERAGYTNDKNVIKEIDFTLKKGELIGLIGPNGAGKSTAIKAVLDLLPVMEGRVCFCMGNKRYAYIPE